MILVKAHSVAGSSPAAPIDNSSIILYNKHDKILELHNFILRLLTERFVIHAVVVT